MDAVAFTSVTLPTGEVVRLSTSEEPWWIQQDGNGYLDPKTLSPDPDQPRRHINQEHLAELAESVAERGVRESITLTPLSKAPWARPAPGFEDAFFLIVSGHRRNGSACNADLPAVPVKIKLYASEMDHRMDASLLNKSRDDLTALEEGMEIVYLKSIGWGLDALQRAFGFKNPGLVYNRINLTKLHPDIQVLLNPELVEARRLPVTMAGILGGISSPTSDELITLQELFQKILSDAGLPVVDFDSLDEDERRFALQKMLLAVIAARKLNALRATAFIRDHTLNLPSHQGRAGRKPERFRADKKRDIISNLAKSVADSVLMDWGYAEFRKAFELASREDVDAALAELGTVGDNVAGLIKILSKVRDEKPPTHPAALRLQQIRAEEAEKRAKL